jgi:FkbM family methyltransferase
MLVYIARGAGEIRPLAARFVRAMPNIRGRGRVVSLINGLLLKAGVEPIVSCEMAAGHRLRLDCRLASHYHAYYSGTYDDAKISALLSFLRPGGTALDVGANIGFYAVPLALAAKQREGRLVAVEPVSSNAAWLRDNLELNHCGDAVVVLPIALANQFGTSEIVLGEDFLSGSNVGNAIVADASMYGSEFRRTTITLDTLDRIWPSIGGRLDIVKIDIEGHEHKFLEGGRTIIAKHRPVILMEVNRWFYDRRGLEFNGLIPTLLPEAYVFAESRPDGQLRRIESLARCADTDVFLIPGERGSRCLTT